MADPRDERGRNWPGYVASYMVLSFTVVSGFALVHDLKCLQLEALRPRYLSADVCLVSIYTL